MLFASFGYLLCFLPIVVLIAIALQKWLGPRAAQFWVLAASIFFYAKSNPFNLVYLFGSLVANWVFARAIDRAEMPNKKRLLVTALVANVVYLCIFKYLGFLASTFHFLLPHDFVMPQMPFPLGISFFTVTQVMYLVDCYEGIVDAGSLVDHATFVSFFPYVISGPLARAKRIRHQFGHFGGEEGKRADNIARGLFQFSMGVFKKTVYADSFARVSNYGYHSANYLSALEGWVFSIAYALQLYFDFSGYSDMAIGSAMMLGIEIPRNFDAPYSATSITDFWQRWHISLTQFITTYLFTPMYKSLKGKSLFKSSTLAAYMLATFLAMGIAGLWHGAAWTFVVYGALHGVYLAVAQFWRKKNMPRLPAFVGWMLTFTGVLVSFIYFGADTVGQATQRVLTLFSLQHPFTGYNLAEMSVQGISLKVFGLPLIAGFFVAFFGRSSQQRAQEFHPTLRLCLYTVVLMSTALVFINSNIPSPFVYFRF